MNVNRHSSDDDTATIYNLDLHIFPNLKSLEMHNVQPHMKKTLHRNSSSVEQLDSSNHHNDHPHHPLGAFVNQLEVCKSRFSLIIDTCRDIWTFQTASIYIVPILRGLFLNLYTFYALMS